LSDPIRTASTLDPRETAYYESWAARWWDLDGPFWPLRRLNATPVSYLRQRLSGHFASDPASAKPLRGIRLLDIGCGGSLLSEGMARLGGDVPGVDVGDKNIRIARLHAAQQQYAIEYETVIAESLAERGASYNALLNMEVVEHVADLPLFIASCASPVRPGGLMIVATLNRTWQFWLGAILLGEYLLGCPKAPIAGRGSSNPTNSTHSSACMDSGSSISWASRSTR
jgi:2-polyprenyl-6-hydroxyphenyl methylase / 3-demethylubiquinone-9 3-methyltransferase